jgi:RNA polymerase sigma-70 factor (ECF subfamily)
VNPRINRRNAPASDELPVTPPPLPLRSTLTAAAEDVVQETFIRIYKTIQSFDISKPFSPWMYTIAKNLCMDVLRKGKFKAQLDWDIEDTKESIISKLIKNEAISSLWKAIRTLPDMYKKPILGYYFANLSYQELAHQLNLSENTIKTRLRRGKNYLRKELGRIGYG